MKKVLMLLLLIFFVPIYATAAEPGCGEIEDSEEMNYDDDYYIEDGSDHPIIGAGRCTNSNYNINNRFKFNGFSVILWLKATWDCDSPTTNSMNYAAQTVLDFQNSNLINSASPTIKGVTPKYSFTGKVRLYSNTFDVSSSKVNHVWLYNEEGNGTNLPYNRIIKDTISVFQSLSPNVRRPWVAYSEHSITLNGMSGKWKMTIPK